MRGGMLMVLTLAASGCTNDHHVRLLLGPTENTLSAGFTCSDENKPGQLLAQRAITADGSVQFNLVVDIVDLGGSLPSCLGEIVAQSCAQAGGPGCTLAVTAAPTRFCRPVTIASSSLTSAAQASAAILAYVHANFADVFDHPPHAPVMVRAVATLQACDDLVTTTTAVWPDLDPDASVGCAYSCPVNLDDATEISLGLGVTVGTGGGNASSCDAVVRACTNFPGS